MVAKLETPLLIAALCLTAIACDTEGSDAASELGSVSLNDSTDTSGKRDDLMGRAVTPYISEIVAYGPQTKAGKTTVTAIDDDGMVVEAPLVTLDAFQETLQLTVSGGENTDLRFFLAYQATGDDGWRIVTVQGEGVFEDGTEPADGEAQATPVVISYFQSASILKSENSISVGSEGSGGQTTARLDFDVGSVQFAALVIPVNSGWGNSLVDAFEYKIDAQCDGVECGEVAVDPEVPQDDYAQARDVDLRKVTIGGGVLDYTAPSVGGGLGLGGTEFWQKWSGGHNPTYSYGEGTDAGRKCMLASAIRFEAIMANPPESIVKLKDQSNWSGRFFNWNDDYSEAPSDGASGAALWAWRTGLIKWISQTGKDGSCYLPTLATVEAAAANCLAKAQSSDGEIQGCQGR